LNLRPPACKAEPGAVFPNFIAFFLSKNAILTRKVRQKVRQFFITHFTLYAKGEAGFLLV